MIQDLVPLVEAYNNINESVEFFRKGGFSRHQLATLETGKFAIVPNVWAFHILAGYFHVHRWLGRYTLLTFPPTEGLLPSALCKSWLARGALWHVTTIILIWMYPKFYVDNYFLLCCCRWRNHRMWCSGKPVVWSSDQLRPTMFPYVTHPLNGHNS